MEFTRFQRVYNSQLGYYVQDMNQVQHRFSLNSLKEIRIVGYFAHSKSRQVFLFAFASILFLITAYLWFISFGLWTSLPTPESYYFYDQLATAFEHGQLSLDKRPSAALLALHNPYDPSTRAGIDYITDFSLYNGKYYLYFGPVPALFLTFIKPFVPGKVGDQYLVIVFVSGICIVQSLLIIKIWERFFHDTPAWMVPLGILFSGLVSPFAWILTQARVYEAASASGQFFFLTGLYLVITSLGRESISSTRLFLAGISWALAIGSRLTQVIPIGFVTLMVAWFALRNYHQTRLLSKTLCSLAALALPLAIGLAALGSYNWVRFHSIFETGFSYQLAGPNLQKYKAVLFSPRYIIPNLYNYLIMPPTINKAFPFVQSVTGNGASLFSFLDLPVIYFSRQLTGLLFSIPFILFSAILIIPFLPGKNEPKDKKIQNHNSYLFKWTAISLFGSFLFGFAPLALYFWLATRFFTDFTPSLVLLSVIGFWQGYAFLIDRSISRKVYVAVGITLIVISILISNLSALSAQAGDFQRFNPILWNHLNNLFSR